MKQRVVQFQLSVKPFCGEFEALQSIKQLSDEFEALRRIYATKSNGASLTKRIASKLERTQEMASSCLQ